MQPDPQHTLQQHAPMIGRIAASYERDADLCQDLVQEIAVAVWRSLPAWRGDAPLHCFIARIAHRRGVDHVASQVRQRQGRQPLDETLADAGPSPAEQFERDDTGRRLLAAIHALPLPWRQVLVLALEGFNQREIGQALGLAENTVAQRMSRARRQMRTTMEAADGR